VTICDTVDSLLLIPNILFSSCIISAINCGPLLEIMLFGNPCSFHTLFLNNLASPSADVFSVVGIKWTIFVNLSTTTKIELYPCAIGSLVIKSANICIQGFSGIELGINLSASYSV